MTRLQGCKRSTAKIASLGSYECLFLAKTLSGNNGHHQPMQTKTRQKRFSEYCFSQETRSPQAGKNHCIGHHKSGQTIAHSAPNFANKRRLLLPQQRTPQSDRPVDLFIKKHYVLLREGVPHTLFPFVFSQCHNAASLRICQRHPSCIHILRAKKEDHCYDQSLGRRKINHQACTRSNLDIFTVHIHTFCSMLMDRMLSLNDKMLSLGNIGSKSLSPPMSTHRTGKKKLVAHKY